MEAPHRIAGSDPRPEATWHRRGHRIVRDAYGRWHWPDGRPLQGGSSPEDPPCARCGQRPGPNGEDPCLGWLPDAVGACCGHGVIRGYVAYPGVARVRLPRLEPDDVPAAPDRAEALRTVGPGWSDRHVAAVADAVRRLAASSTLRLDVEGLDEATATQLVRRWLRSACSSVDEPLVLHGTLGCRLLLVESVQAADVDRPVAEVEAAVLSTVSRMP